ncbi:hypothetical protein N7539_008398 [Penicillium diatomitis]|uniref:Methyltransferase type 11 domain-containing protein n=1 Tax=Penicillium diatomitis TaxID=2819901 RepID=A0A9X0BNL2_9EURO|nr:uncharacterized protein N7539_008398 [Penicillium diatomitis]KAJ5475332.1 hypothetical protein N7539_008398 [Penicillium diatomitis]
MADLVPFHSMRCPPLRQPRGTMLDPILEDVGESNIGDAAVTTLPSKPAQISPKLTLKTSGLPAPKNPRLARLMSPLSAGTLSSCSDYEWQQEIRDYDDMYDATDDNDTEDDNSTEISESCFSGINTQRSSLITPITRNSVTSTGSRRSQGTRDFRLKLDIPSSTQWPSLNGTCKNSPVPPTPPSKIPVSPAAWSLLSRDIPASFAPPSLDGSVSSDQESNSSALATPDSNSLPDTDWDSRDLHVRPDVDDPVNHLTSDDNQLQLPDEVIAIEASHDDWRHSFGRFDHLLPALHNISLDSLNLEADITDELPVREPTPSDDGVFLPDGALAMLQQIPLDRTPETWSETSEDDEMWQLQPAPRSRPRSFDGATPASELSGYSFSELSIPSPGGFFASLAPRARHTWSIPNTNIPPTTAVAEGFYDLPFSRDQGEVVEQVIEWPDHAHEEDPDTAVRIEEGPLTAIRLPCETPARPLTRQDNSSPISATFEAVQEITQPRNVYEYDELYETELEQRAAASLDRTSVWLNAQATYLAALNETNPINEVDSKTNFSSPAEPVDHPEDPELTTKKSVRFLEGVPESLSPDPPMFASKDSIYWRGFQSIRQRGNATDGFLHRNMRFDAIQSFRVGLLETHLNGLMGKYELTLPKRPAYKGPFSQAPRNSIITSVLAEKAQFAKLEKEQLVLAQLCQPMWAMDALRCLNGGQLLTSPVEKRARRVRKTPHGQPRPNLRPVRILDLGGHASCEWGWHAALEFPQTKVYSVVSQTQTVNSAIKGPPNHRVVTVDRLWELPFGNNKFDVITTRSLHALLKSQCPAGLDRDEYDLVLKECRRCLKPGGYLEFMVLDAAISRAGPCGSAASDDFAHNLRANGYDPAASKQFLARLRQGGFVNIKRAWMFLPMGTEPLTPEPPRETPAPRVQSQIEDYEAVQGPIGSTEDIASVTGILGGWMWEQWLVRLRSEMGQDRSKLLDGVGALFDEGRKTGAGWTCLSGWAMKPKVNKKTTHLRR